MGLGIKKGDTVLVTTGKEKGKKGRVLSVMLSKDKLIIGESKHYKKTYEAEQKYSQGGIIEKEAPVHISNVMLICPRCSKPARIASMTFDSGKKSRVCKNAKKR